VSANALPAVTRGLLPDVADIDWHGGDLVGARQAQVQGRHATGVGSGVDTDFVLGTNTGPLHTVNDGFDMPVVGHAGRGCADAEHQGGERNEEEGAVVHEEAPDA
jgi:hypothetical protein